MGVQDKRENLVRAPAQPDQSGRIRERNDNSAGNGDGGADNKNRATDNKTTEVENVNGIDLRCGDALEELKTLPDGLVDLVLTDPPYNIGVQETRAGSKTVAAWDKIENYTDWCIEWLNECSRVLKPNGVLYFWHNDMAQIAELLHEIAEKTDLVLVSFCIWDKGDTYRPRSWKQRDPEGTTALRSWFNVCEYCLHFFKAPRAAGAAWRATGLDRINSNPECYKPLKDWYKSELDRLGITAQTVAKKYTAVTGKKPHMLKHYFRDSQFEIPTREIWDTVYRPLGFGKEYEELRREYEELRREYEELRNYHRCDDMHCNIWHEPPIPSTNRLHTCQKPVKILARLIRVSCRPGGTVLDCFMGSGSTGEAAILEGRSFVGIERDAGYFEIAKNRIEQAAAQLRLEI